MIPDGRVLRVCYVLVGNGWDRHAKMLWLSAQSLRRHEPGARITVAVDRGTHSALDDRLLSAVDEIAVIDSGDSDPRLRAFHLKTLLRQHLAGDFLYLDTDTLVVNRLADILDLDVEV